MAEHDYHIYLHGVGGSNSNSPSMKTTPFANRQEKASDGGDISSASFVQQGMQRVYSVTTQGGSQFVSQGASLLKKASPWIALAIATFQISSQVVKERMQYQETFTGDYSFSMGLNNFVTGFQNLLNPYGHWRYQENRNLQFFNQNRRLEQQKSLVGNLYSSYRGV